MRKLETTRWYFGDSREGFPAGTLAETVYRDYRRVREVADMVLELAESSDELDRQVSRELNRMGYAYRAVPAGPAPVKTEIITPTHLIRILTTGGARRLETAGQSWGGESEDWLEAQVFDRHTFDDDQAANQPDKYALPEQQQQQ